MPFLNIHSEEVYDRFPMEGEWTMLARMRVRDMWAGHLQGHADHDSCFLYNFTVCVGLGGQEVDKWMLVCSVSKQSWYAGSGIICSEYSFLYMLFSLFAKMQNTFISSLHIQVFPLEFSARGVQEVALQWTLCCSTSAAQNQSQHIIGAWCILRGMAQYCSVALWVF